MFSVSLSLADDPQGQDYIRAENGMLQPVLTWTDLRDEDYTNEGSDVLCFCVWVETDHDTDPDGKADLVKALIQVPAPRRKAVTGPAGFHRRLLEH